MLERGTLVLSSGKQAGYQRNLMVGQKDAWFMAMMGRESVREPLYIWEDDVRPDRDLAHSPLCEACCIEQRSL
jgi:hypothetical protein